MAAQRTEAEQVEEIPSDDLPMSTREAARLAGVSHRTLEGLRYRGGGPAYRKLGARVVYVRRDVLAWRDSHSVVNTAQTPGEGA